MNLGRSLHWTLVAIIFGELVVVGALRAGTVQLIDGTVHQGAISIDGGLWVKGKTSVKLSFPGVLLARFADRPAANDFPPGIVLTNGTRIAGEFTRLGETTVRLEQKGIRIPSEGVAWLVYQSFPAALTASIPTGKTGALLRGGDFFEGAVKSGDRNAVKVVHSIFGPRTFAAAGKELQALVIRGIAPQPAAFAILTRDGSRYLAQDITPDGAAGVILRHPDYDGLRIASAELAEIRAFPHRMLFLGEKPPQRLEDKGQVAPQPLPGPRIPLNVGENITWKFPTSGGTFLARVSFPAGEAPQKKLSFVVLADDRIIFRTMQVDAGGISQTIACPMPAANAITLRVEGDSGIGIWEDPIIFSR